MPLDMMDNSIKPLRTHFGLIFSSFGRTIISSILQVRASEPALTCTKPPITISRVSSHFIHAQIMPNYPPPRGAVPLGYRALRA